MNTENQTDSRPDYELAREELDVLFTKLFPYFPTVRFIERAVKDANGWEHNLYVLEIKGQRFEYRCGMGIKRAPTGGEILGSYARDYLSAHEAGCFEDWAEEFGYETDSRKAEDVYKACLKGGTKLRALKLDRATIAKLAELSGRL